MAKEAIKVSRQGQVKQTLEPNSPLGSTPMVSFQDNRSENIAQMKLQSMANSFTSKLPNPVHRRNANHHREVEANSPTKAPLNTSSEPLQLIKSEEMMEAKPTALETVVQRVPTKNDDQWEDTAVNDTKYPTALALFQANIDTYEGYSDAELLPIMGAMKEYLTPTQLRGLLGDRFKTKVTNVKANLNIRTIKMHGVNQGSINTNILAANVVLGKANITINVGEAINITAHQMQQGISGLDHQGNLAKDYDGEEIWTLIGQYSGGAYLPVLYVPNFTGHGWFSKPNGTTIELTKGLAKRTMVVMRPGQSGQTLAHELGHAMGGIIGPIQHGQHVDNSTQLNLMHGNPIVASWHTHLRREQIAAFKGSKYITLT